MKHWLLRLLILLSAATCLAQTPAPTALRINRLPATGLLLAKSWRYHAGDNPAWARPDFDDSRWDTLNPTRPRRVLPLTVQAGISWLRLRVQPGDSLQRRALLLQAGALGACQVYCNGQLILRQGTLSADPTRVHPSPVTSAPVELSGLGTEQVLAVRVVPWQRPLLRDADQLPLLRLSLLTVRQLWQQGSAAGGDGGSIYYIIAGVFVVLTLIRLAFFRYTPAQRANLYFALYALCLAVGTVSFNYRGSRYLSIEAWLLLNILPNALLALSNLFAVRALYYLFDFQAGRLYAGLWVSFAILLPFYGLHQFSALGSGAFMVIMVLVTAEQLRLTGRAVYQRRRGAWMLNAGFAGALVAVLGYSSLAVLPIVVPAKLANLFFSVGFCISGVGSFLVSSA